MSIGLPNELKAVIIMVEGTFTLNNNLIREKQMYVERYEYNFKPSAY